mmetsp:Transcript_12782/g.35352  ORF Transcript_12782/g.35352 Transcript_12782/m.35352 type:complete len:538 (-) Transcript_12782:94-1707(-)
MLLRARAARRGFPKRWCALVQRSPIQHLASHVVPCTHDGLRRVPMGRNLSAVSVTGGARTSVPVILVSGFLGAGKTTLLEHLLTSSHGLRLGVLVNDLASVNVDARVLKGALQRAGARSVELANGCVCCSASDDLLRSVLELLRPEPAAPGAAGRAPDAIVVELSGVAEPRAVRGVLEQLEERGTRVARTVALVDSPTFAADFGAGAPAPGGGAGWPGPAEGAERLSTLLAEQLECADLVLLNKADIATEAEIHRATAMVHALNRTAVVLSAKHGRVPPEVILPNSLFVPVPESTNQERRLSSRDGEHRDHGGGPAHVHWHGHGHGHADKSCADPCCSDHSHDHRSSTERRFGIRSFVYTAYRPFSRLRFMTEVERWQQAWRQMGRTLELKEEGEALPTGTAGHGLDGSAAFGTCSLAPVLRSKGLLWMDSQPRDALYWSHAGRCARLAHWGFWPHFPSVTGPGAAAGPGSRSAEAARAAFSEWTGAALGRARSELVFIGAGIDEPAVRAALDGCLLTDEELAGTPSVPRPGLPDRS